LIDISDNVCPFGLSSDFSAHLEWFQ